MRLRGTGRRARRVNPAFAALLGAVAVERVVELVVARRHGQWARERGGVEHGAGHYPVMVALHSGLLVGSLVEHAAGRRAASQEGSAPFHAGPALAVCAGQALRWWCIRSLGPYWNTRVVVVPGHELVATGPYRWLPHPNYLAVVVEGAALPLAGGARWTAGVFTVTNAVLLRHRIAVEERALATVAP
ncbi:isoprenylcysteine carboxyl methyltransferase family protein [Kytococcus sedentarius]|uniref:isoprenylcysteine carboxyl methyltransferase family protein n=1 Tax=Kytococcus sedentarius TaxID=1276 RepID=UPI0035BC0183